ncbi:hypothetical protein KC318_g6345, partial [Hortaea werneckii]
MAIGYLLSNPAGERWGVSRRGLINLPSSASPEASDVSVVESTTTSWIAELEGGNEGIAANLSENEHSPLRRTRIEKLFAMEAGNR